MVVLTIALDVQVIVVLIHLQAPIVSNYLTSIELLASIELVQALGTITLPNVFLLKIHLIKHIIVRILICVEFCGFLLFFQHDLLVDSKVLGVH